MAEPEQRRDRVPSPDTGRHSHRRRARSRRTGEKKRGFSLGTFGSRVASWITIVVGVGILIGQLAFTWLVLPDHLMRGALTVVGVLVLAALLTWIDQSTSKKRDPKPRWMRGVLIAGFLSISVVVGSLLVLTLTAGPTDDRAFQREKSVLGHTAPLEQKSMQLKLFAFHIIATVAGLALLVHARGPEKHRRSSSGQFKAISAVPPT